MADLVVPYTKRRLQERTVAAALGWKHDAQLVDVGDSDHGYANLLDELWGRQRPVILMEHDIVAAECQLDALARCEHPWCAYTYAPHETAEYADWGTITMLGCCKLSPTLMQATPFVWEPRVPWWHCDVRLSTLARAAGFEPHQHYPNVEHLN